jgi:hypothetical protein
MTSQLRYLTFENCDGSPSALQCSKQGGLIRECNATDCHGDRFVFYFYLSPGEGALELSWLLFANSSVETNSRGGVLYLLDGGANIHNCVFYGTRHDVYPYTQYWSDLLLYTFGNDRSPATIDLVCFVPLDRFANDTLYYPLLIDGDRTTWTWPVRINLSYASGYRFVRVRITGGVGEFWRNASSESLALCRVHTASTAFAPSLALAPSSDFPKSVIQPSVLPASDLLPPTGDLPTTANFSLTRTFTPSTPFNASKPIEPSVIAPSVLPDSDYLPDSPTLPTTAPFSRTVPFSASVSFAPSPTFPPRRTPGPPTTPSQRATIGATPEFDEDAPLTQSNVDGGIIIGSIFGIAFVACLVVALICAVPKCRPSPVIRRGTDTDAEELGFPAY